MAKSYPGMEKCNPGMKKKQTRHGLWQPFSGLQRPETAKKGHHRGRSALPSWTYLTLGRFGEGQPLRPFSVLQGPDTVKKEHRGNPYRSFTGLSATSGPSLKPGAVKQDSLWDLRPWPSACEVHALPAELKEPCNYM